ncbi:MurR/RpiR family transcriptional regulator [Mesobacillus maritimus]|uniref:MurR/RpiR family transcriptional regulator n=1 Tax=Mesobacillus maritimus TaxID=1643336 RepID=UPI00203D68F7|nr:MurR/RpiR family transcriptional regulator [Mesobacillus maritimus]MCM3584315.1 MurR/RpiR family transcriptional regulator [Mesobacillus maritimus]MCM3669268.1 MurR/RpiR family transcriptional regulator [Mesobacillus maritimus]
MENKQLNEIIKESYPSLSPGQKKVAEYIKAHLDEGALHTAYQIGKKAGVSETTVIRLAYALGFSGFSGLQEKIRIDWLADKHASMFDDTASNDVVEQSSIFESVIAREKNVLNQLLSQLNQNDFWEAVDKITNADVVYIASFGSSYAAGYWLYYALRQFRANVYISNPNGFIPEDVQDLSEDSIVVIFSYPRFRTETLTLMNMVKRQKVKTIAITNRQLSPVGPLADITLTTEEKVENGHNSIASVISLLEMILAGIQTRDHVHISVRQRKLEQLYSNQNLFIE